MLLLKALKAEAKVAQCSNDYMTVQDLDIEGVAPWRVLEHEPAKGWGIAGVIATMVAVVVGGKLYSRLRK